MNYFILIVADSDKRRLSRPSAYDLAAYRLGRGEWGLNEQTRSRKEISSGDKVVIYASGKRHLGMSFVASATVGKNPTFIPDHKRGLVDSPPGQQANLSTYFFPLTSVRLFPTPLPIVSIKTQLSFVRNTNPTRWGVCLIGGVRKISQADYTLIVDAAMRAGRSSAKRSQTTSSKQQ